VNILILEDEPYVMALTRSVLKTLGQQILEASTADEAIQRFQETDGIVHLLIADVTLRVSSGIRVAVELRSKFGDLKVILMSGYPPDMWGEADKRELNELPAGSVAILQKPFMPATLLETVHRLLRVPAQSAPAQGAG
jgi:CheY-like chemotaxis protein